MKWGGWSSDVLYSAIELASPPLHTYWCRALRHFQIRIRIQRLVKLPIGNPRVRLLPRTNVRHLGLPLTYSAFDLWGDLSSLAVTSG
jgi:hypothetical protein